MTVRKSQNAAIHIAAKKLEDNYNRKNLNKRLLRSKNEKDTFAN